MLLGSIFQISSGYNPWTFNQPDEATRISSFFGDKLVMGSYVSRLTPLFLAIGVLLNFKKKNIIILIIASILILLSAERLSFIYLIIFLCFYFLLTLKVKNFFFTIFMFFIMFSTIFFIFPKNFERFFVHTYKQIQQNKNILGLSYVHNLHYATAWNMFLDKKFIGHGLKTFRVLCRDPKYTLAQKIINDHTFVSPKDGFMFVSYYEKDGSSMVNFFAINLGPPYIYHKNNQIIFDKEIKIQPHTIIYHDRFGYIKKNQKIFYTSERINGCTTHPHNLYLEFLAELGLVGFFFLLSVLIYSIFHLLMLVKKKLTRKLDKKEICQFLVLINIFMVIIPIFPSGSYFNNWMLILSYLPIGFYLYLKKSKNV